MEKLSELSKRQDFLWIVQSTYLANGINMSNQEKYREVRRHQYSGLGVKNEMCDAIKASYLIPHDINAVTAAEDYLNWKLFSDGDPEQHREIPRWITPGFAGWEK